MDINSPKTSFICVDCHRTVNIPANDWGHYELKGFYCTECFSVIASRKYQINIPGANTVFYYIGQALGDVVVFDAIRRAYLEDNPDENVTFMTSESPIPQNIDKFFISDLRVKSILFKLAPLCYEYIVISEVHNLRKRGVYPQWRNFKKPNIELPEKYIVCQLRNIEKADFKNVIVSEAILLFEILNKADYPVVLVGNDKPIGVELTAKNLIDLRNNLTLDEIAWLCRGAEFTVCKDSGLGHLAGSAGGKLISWNFVNKKWIPWAPAGGWCFMSDTLEYLNFLNKLKSLVGET